ncbi:hypothetical protein PQO03_19735 [Lentisphaera profundi]|uniref:Transglutaminase-like domain-containing protein n=1 Tax=Lentisphaera profundi TaxID=1658616 RepID=A0ABY7VXP5_9BACT|nr:hypothetical protein [Lentisphaera profundi]WDE98054.1 hypothetical protein PQO03_19735 [Lentisphaera profundi]
MKTYLLTSVLLLLISSCKEDTPEDSLARLRMPPNQQISIVTEDQLTGETNKLTMKSTNGGILVYGIEEDNSSEAIPNYTDLVSQLIGGKNKKKTDSKKQVVPLKLGDFIIIKWPKAEDHQSRLKYQWQNPKHPQLIKLIKDEQIENIIDNKDEVQKFLALNNWTRAQWQPGSPKIYPPWNANTILQMIRQKRTGGFCGQYTQVLAQTLTALGYNTRYLWLNAHFSMEVYSNTLNKWIIIDPFYHCVLKKGDQYLNAYETYKLLEVDLDNKEIQIIDSSNQNELIGEVRNNILKAYENFVIDLKMNHLEENKGGTSYVLNYWKHSAMLAEKKNLEFDFVSIPPLLTPWPQDLYAKQNQTAFKVLALNDKFISFELNTNTPFHTKFEARVADQQYRKISDNKLNIQINEGSHTISVRSINNCGIPGPSSEFTYEYKKRP